ncbi:MAG: 3-hydroxyacyl-CoA dehydrogenase family protein, partial [Acidobacteriota bacterium]|nr:3-hydroxyacyl-CoA dehydrogenase family protein [Acidobacteriota bacterium]
MKPIRRVAVLGAGTMGSRIAAHFANARIPSVLLDLDTATAKKGLEAALKGRPGAFFEADSMSLITPGGFDTDLGRVRECDWIVEAVSENLEIKRALYDKLMPHRTSGTIVSTNTSGIPLAHIAEGYPEDFREHFLGTHFFNPPRYLHLAELIPGPATNPDVLRFIAEFCDLHLGKGVVPCKDTPNFIANRIGSFLGSTIQKLTVDLDLTVEEVDALTGPLIGLPKSASFRLLDIVGIDVWAHVTNNLREAAPDDPFRGRFVMQPFLTQMIERGWLGDKRGQGCYKRVGKQREIHAIDWKTLEYHPAAKVQFASLESVRKIEPLADRLKALVTLDDKAGRFLWQVLSDHVLYAAHMAPEISDRIVEIDRAMRWGYANALGPFELWDALGFEATAHRIEGEGRVLPENVRRMLSQGAASFYRAADSDHRPRNEYFDLAGGSGYREVEARPGVTVLSDV